MWIGRLRKPIVVVQKSNVNPIIYGLQTANIQKVENKFPIHCIEELLVEAGAGKSALLR